MALDFFRHIIAPSMRKAKPLRIKLSPEGKATLRARLKEQGHDITDEELDEELGKLQQKVSTLLESDLDAVVERAEKLTHPLPERKHCGPKRKGEHPTPL